MDELLETDCAQCGEFFLGVNLDSCLICRKCQRACGSCLRKHQSKHSAAEVEAFKREMLGEPPMNERERTNAELKAQIRKQAETICTFIDNYEALTQKYEHQCRILAEEVDRRTPAA